MIDVVEIPDREQLNSLVSKLKLVPQTAAVPMVQAAIRPHVMQIFAEHEPEMVERFIMTNYSVVDNHTPPHIRRLLNNIGPEFRGPILQFVREENIIAWLERPDEWLDDSGTEAERERMQACAEAIKETDGGMEWLSMQVYQLYDMANLIETVDGTHIDTAVTDSQPKQSTPSTTDD